MLTDHVERFRWFMNPEQPPQQLTVKGLRDLGATKLAEAAERTINRLREVGAPDISEDQVIRSILKQASKSQAIQTDLTNRKGHSPKVELVNTVSPPPLKNARILRGILTGLGIAAFGFLWFLVVNHVPLLHWLFDLFSQSSAGK